MPKVNQRVLRNPKNTNIAGLLQDIDISLFLYIDKKEKLKHIFYISYQSNNTWEKIWAIEDLTLKQTANLIKKTLTQRVKISLNLKLRSEKGFLHYFDEEHIKYIKNYILSTPCFKKNTEYISNHYAYEQSRIESYVSKIL